MFFFFSFFLFMFSFGAFIIFNMLKNDTTYNNTNYKYTDGIITGTGKDQNIYVRFPAGGDYSYECGTRNFDIKKYPIGSIVKLSYSHDELFGLKMVSVKVENDDLKVTSDEIIGNRFLIIAKITLVISIILLILGIVFMFI